VNNYISIKKSGESNILMHPIYILELFTNAELENYLFQNPTNESASVGEYINPNNLEQFTFGESPSSIHKYALIIF